MLQSNISDVIFENYDNYLMKHKEDFATPQGAIEVLSTDGGFQSYVGALTEGLDSYQQAAVMAVCERQREFLLEESTQIGPSSSVIGYAVKN